MVLVYVAIYVWVIFRFCIKRGAAFQTQLIMTSYKGHGRVGVCRCVKTHLDQHHPTVAGHLDLFLTAHRGFPGDEAGHEAFYFQAMMNKGSRRDLYAEAEALCCPCAPRYPGLDLVICKQFWAEHGDDGKTGSAGKQLVTKSVSLDDDLHEFGGHIGQWMEARWSSGRSIDR